MNYDCMYRNMIAGGISGFVEVTSTHPIDLVKTKMQQSSKTKDLGNPMKYMKTIYSEGGITSLYKGYLPRMLGVVPMRLLFWSTQETVNNYSKEFINNDETRYIFSGLLAGSVQTLIDVPVENLKVRSITSDVSLMNRTNNLFAGFYPNLLRNIGFAISLNCFIHLGNDHNSKVEDFFRASMGALIGAIVTQPLDYIKTQLQMVKPKYKNSRDVFVKTMKISPIHFYTGTFPRAFMSFLNMGIGWCVFSEVKKHVTL